MDDKNTMHSPAADAAAWLARFRSRYQERLAEFAAHLDAASIAPDAAVSTTLAPQAINDGATLTEIEEQAAPATDAANDLDGEIERFTSLFSQAYASARHPQLRTRTRGALCGRRSLG